MLAGASQKRLFLDKTPAYALVLPFEGRLLQKREQKILSEVTEEVE